MFSYHLKSVLPPKKRLLSLTTSWIEEDIPSFDFGMSVVGDKKVEAVLYCKQQVPIISDLSNEVQVIIAGIPFFESIMKDYFECDIEWLVKDGDRIKMRKDNGELWNKLPVAKIRGKAVNILQGERIALNVLTRCAGIATMCRVLRDHADEHAFKGQLAATRKTTPGFRLVEKYGAIAGGFSPHRFDVSQMCMLKDNHIDACGGDIAKAIQSVRELAGFSLMIEVECRSMQDARTAAKNGAHVIMLDNFAPEDFKSAAKVLKKEFPHVVIEGSGGLSINTLQNFFCDDCDVLSMSFTIQGHSSVDFSLKIEKDL